MHNDIQDVSEADLQNTAQDEHEYKICKRNFVFIARLNHLIDFPTLSILFSRVEYVLTISFKVMNGKWFILFLDFYLHIDSSQQ